MVRCDQWMKVSQKSRRCPDARLRYRGEWLRFREVHRPPGFGSSRRQGKGLLRPQAPGRQRGSPLRPSARQRPTNAWRMVTLRPGRSGNATLPPHRQNRGIDELGEDGFPPSGYANTGTLGQVAANSQPVGEQHGRAPDVGRERAQMRGGQHRDAHGCCDAPADGRVGSQDVGPADQDEFAQGCGRRTGARERNGHGRRDVWRIARASRSHHGDAPMRDTGCGGHGAGGGERERIGAFSKSL